MKLTDEQYEAIRKVFLDADTDAYHDRHKPLTDYADRVREIVEAG